MRNRKTTGQLSATSPPICHLELRQDADSVFPRPYVHKVGSAGKMWRGTLSGPLFSALGIRPKVAPQTTGAPQQRGRLFGSLGINATPSQPPTLAGPRLRHNNPVVIGIEPESWEPGEGLLDNIGELLEYEPLEADCVAIVFKPASGRVSAKKRTLPVELCHMCQTKAEFVGWCARFSLPAEAGQAWDEITRRPRPTVGRPPQRPF